MESMTLEEQAKMQAQNKELEIQVQVGFFNKTNLLYLSITHLQQ